MGKLYALGNLTIRVYANDHLPRHFHVVAPDFEALIDIDMLTVLRATLPRAVRRQVLDWADHNRPAIEAEWNRINPRFPIDREASE